MLYNFFRIKSPSLFFFVLFLFSFTADGVTVFCNMAEDESLFTGRGDYQFDVYRLMKKANKYVLFNCTSSIKKIVVFKRLSYRNLPSRKSNCLRGRIKVFSSLTTFSEKQNRIVAVS